ncbi:hypothetical protein VTJ04DRAFT_3213 [Mycothermus thermophilus]|uniref:uncharacterized protein n=1 Tax=Humicola insolens TaxID=85995 RepID=UPI00374243D9
MMLSCSICHRPGDPQKLPFLCAVDARNRLYETRIQYTRALIENEHVERRVEAALMSAGNGGEGVGLPPRISVGAGVGVSDGGRGMGLGGLGVDLGSGVGGVGLGVVGVVVEEEKKRSAEMDRLRAEEEAARDRTSQIIAQAERLRSEMEAVRKEIAARKDAIARKRSDLASVSKGTPARWARQLKEAEQTINRQQFLWHRCADTMAATRVFLCESSARLYGLRQVKKGSTKRYEIGGVEVLDLHAMNTLSPEVISTSLAHVVHILVLACHYLGLRLPAEITPPHADYPRPTIFSLQASYRHGPVPFPGSVVAQIPPSAVAAVASGSGSVAGGDGSTGDERGHIPRPRPLFVDKPLPTLARDDPAAYSLFLEGVSLLAYDIAWACCSQGVVFGDRDSYEDVCNMGQNLWRLLIGDQLHRRPADPTSFPASLTPPGGGSPRNAHHDGSAAANPKSILGRWSHTTLHNFLGDADGVAFVRGFKLISPLKLADRLKKSLLSEAHLAEWEKIETGELEEDGFDDGVLVRNTSGGSVAAVSGGASAGVGAGRGVLDGREDLGDVVAASGTGAGTGAGASVGSSSGNRAAARGTSGWTRIRNR